MKIELSIIPFGFGHIAIKLKIGMLFFSIVSKIVPHKFGKVCLSFQAPKPRHKLGTFTQIFQQIVLFKYVSEKPHKAA